MIADALPLIHDTYQILIPVKKLWMKTFSFGPSDARNARDMSVISICSDYIDIDVDVALCR